MENDLKEDYEQLRMRQVYELNMSLNCSTVVTDQLHAVLC